MLDYKRVISNREIRIKISNLLRFIPSQIYLKLVFRMKTGKRLNLKNPVTFCDKMNWLKLHNLHPEYIDMADKIKVRGIVSQKLGKDISFPILGQWKKYEEIDFEKLPDKFVLKCNHDSGSVKVVHNKNLINHKELKHFFDFRLSINSYVLGREYPYKNIEPMIYAEDYMVPDGYNDIDDYKFFCFDGKPVILFVATERSIDCKFDFYDMDFNHLDIVNIHPQSGNIIDKPKCFDEMKEIAAILSKGMKFVRIDLYEIQDRVYFGEYTFFHGGGFWPMSPEYWEEKLGSLINIDKSEL